MVVAFEFFKELVLLPFMLIVNQEHEYRDILCIREITFINQKIYPGHKFGLGLARTGVQCAKVIPEMYHANVRLKVILECIQHVNKLIFVFMLKVYLLLVEF